MTGVPVEAIEAAAEAIYDKAVSWLPVNGTDCEHLASAAIEAAMPAIREHIAQEIEAAFTGLDYEENAQEAAGEGEWSWFKWLARSTIQPGWPNVRGGTP